MIPRQKEKKKQESNKEEPPCQSHISPSLVLDANGCVIIRAPLENWYTGNYEETFERIWVMHENGRTRLECTCSRNILNRQKAWVFPCAAKNEKAEVWEEK